MKEQKHLEMYGGLGEDIGMKTYLHGPMDHAKKRKVRFRDLDLLETRKRHTSNREEEDESVWDNNRE